jgi:uncharacterized protein (TIGR02147 family)
MFHGESDYRNILKEELESRFQRNSHYSLRAFARDLGVSPARLSDSLAGRAGFSTTVADQIAKKLGFGKEEREYFCTLVEMNHARSKSQRAAAAEKLQSLKSNVSSDYQQVQIDSFKVISDWHHFAILELTAIDGFKSEAQWIADQLEISVFSVEQAIERLIRLDLLEKKKDVLVATEARTASPSGIPSDAIKKFHTQVLEKAMNAIQVQGVDERDFSTTFMSIDRSRIPEAKEKIKKFRREFSQEFANSSKKENVYCFSTQFFNLTKNSVKKGSQYEK